METRYHTLTTLYNIVKDDAQPEKYGCRPREIILRQMQEWDTIKLHLETLEAEGFVGLQQQDTLVISITAAGMEKALSLVNESKIA